MELISLFQLSSHLGQSCLYQEWAILDGYNPTLYAFDKNDKENPRMEVNFDLEDTSKKEEVVENVTTYNMNDVEPTTPAWIAALKNTRNSKK